MRPNSLTAIAGITFMAALGLFASEATPPSRWAPDGLAGQPVRLLSSSGEPNGAVFAGTDSGLFRSRGGIWARLPVTFVPSCIAAEPGNSDVVWAGVRGSGSPSRLYRSSNGGFRFLDHSNLAYGAHCPIAVDPAETSRVFVGNPSNYGFTKLSMSTNDGIGWTQLSLDDLIAEVASLVIDPDRHAIYAGTDVDSFYYFGENGVIGSRDGGSTWQGLLARANAEVGEILQVGDLAVEPASGTIYAATRDIASYSIFRSRDGGSTWGRTVAGLPPAMSLTSLAVDPGPPAAIYAATGGAGVFRSLDGGDHWAPLNEGLTSLLVHSLDFDVSAGVLRAATEDGVFALRPEQSPSSCEPGEDRACLLGGRFQVELAALNARTGREVVGAVVLAQDRYAVFSLPALTGDASFAEVVIKMLDPAGPHGHRFWVFHGSLTSAPYALTVTDTATGSVEIFRNGLENPFCGEAATGAFVDHADPADLDLDPGWRTARRSGTSEASLSLLDDRFSVTLSAYSARHDRTEGGVAVPGTDRWGYFSLPGFTGDTTFPEVVVKMLDFRRISGDFLIFHAGLTNLAYTLTVTDQPSGEVRIYQSPGAFCGAVASETFPDPPARPVDLSGEWEGTLSFPDSCFDQCADIEDVRISISQNQNTISGSIPTVCRGNISFDGTLEGGNLTIDLHRSGLPDLVGPAHRERILVGGFCEISPWDYSGHSMTLELHRAD